MPVPGVSLAVMVLLVEAGSWVPAVGFVMLVSEPVSLLPLAQSLPLSNQDLSS